MNDLVPATSQAAAMLRRVSPKGRAQAARERERHRRATLKLVGRCALAALLVVGVLVRLSATFVVPPLAYIAAAVMVAVAWLVIAHYSRDRPVTAERLAAAPIVALPEAATAWLEAKRPALPAPAAMLLDGIGDRLGALRPQLARLDPGDPAADAVRKLVGVELPNLVDRYATIPDSLRPGGNGREGADAHLLRGLGIVDSEIARMTEQLASGSFDALATQHRYLELKYDERSPGLDAGR